MEEIIVIRATDPDGSVFKAVMDALQEKKAEVIDIAAPAPSVLFLGELEIRPAYRQALLAGKEIRLNHGEYAMLYCMAKTPGCVYTREQLYAAAWDEIYPYGTNTVENTIFRLRQKIEADPKHLTKRIHIKERGGYQRMYVLNHKEERNGHDSVFPSQLIQKVFWFLDIQVYLATIY